jgi:hypothetical protein
MAGVTKEQNRTATSDAERKTARDIDITSTPSTRAASSTPSVQQTGESQRGENQDAGWMDRVRERAGEQLTTQKNRATEGIGSIASAVRNTTQELRQQQHDTIAEYVATAADQLDRLSTRLQNKEVSELFRDAQNLARRQPVMFVGSAFLLGLVGARFFKSSPPHHYLERNWRQGPGGTSYGQSGGAFRGQTSGQTSAYEGRTTAEPSMPNPTRPVVSNPDMPGRMTPQAEKPYGNR